MGTFTFFIRPVQDPEFGISHSNITRRLKRTNWWTKAICRVREGRCLYILVQRGRVSDHGRNFHRYFVEIHFGSDEDRSFKRDFPRLKEALAFANGEDGSKFAKETRPAEVWEYPTNREADTYITGFERSDEHLMPNFTARIPGGPSTPW